MAISLRPSVEFNVVEQSRIASGIPNFQILVIGTASWGPVGSIQDVESYNQVAAVYKNGRLVDGALNVSLGGSPIMRVVRVADGTETNATNDLLDGSSASTITITAKYPGTHGNSITVEVYAIGSNFGVKISDGSVVEDFNNAGDGYPSNADIVNAINANSSLVTATDLAGGALVAQTVTLTGGTDGSSPTASDIANLITTLATEDFDIVVTPGITTDSDHSVILGAVESRYTSEKRGAVYIGGVATDEDVATIKSRTTYSADGRFVLVAPGGYEVGGRIFDGSYLACVYAGLVASLQLGVSATRKPVNIGSLIVDSLTNKTTYFGAEVEQLIEKGVTVINKIGNYLGVERAVTRITDITSPFFELSILFIKDSIEIDLRNKLQPFLGEPNTDQKRRVIGSVVTAVLENYLRQGSITQYNQEVLPGSSADEVIVNIIALPVFPINFIKITMVI